jgi:hypothetical protein
MIGILSKDYRLELHGKKCPEKAARRSLTSHKGDPEKDPQIAAAGF